MKILSPQQIRIVDAYTIGHEPVASIDLMERAALACVRWIMEHFDSHRRVVIFSGPGNNGGDGLAIARLLQGMRYDVSVYMLTDANSLSPDAAINYQRLSECQPVVLTSGNMPDLQPSTLVVDAMFGVGLTRTLAGLAAQTVMHINRSGATVISIDMPSGLFCENNENNDFQTIIRASYTLTFQQPKLSFFFAENVSYLGEWVVLNIGLLPEIIEQQPSDIYALRIQDVARWTRTREKFSHKGIYGHACIIAGSNNMMGAAVLAVRACLRAGVGLVTAHVPQKEGQIIQMSVPEALVSADQHPGLLSQIPDLSPFSAIAIGPGIGKNPETRQALLALLNMINTKKPGIPTKLVLDADALNILSENKDWLKLLPSNCIITPHPKEFDRLAGNSENGYQRYLKQVEFAKKYAIFVVLKGAHTSIVTPNGCTFFNTTGNPGMATGGTGDVLTGIIVSLLAQGWSPCHAACAGVWLHGAAGDNAARKNGQQAVIASDIIKNIGKVFKKLQVKKVKS